jgi:hypothetical protein
LIGIVPFTWPVRSSGTCSVPQCPDGSSGHGCVRTAAFTEGAAVRNATVKARAAARLTNPIVADERRLTVTVP